MTLKNTLLLGASPKPERYSYKAMLSLSDHMIPCIAIGKRNYQVANVEVLDSWDDDAIQNIHTVTLYLSSKNQSVYIEDVIMLKPERVIFNPGTENQEFEELLQEAGIEYLHACTLVLLATGQY